MSNSLAARSRITTHDRAVRPRAYKRSAWAEIAALILIAVLLLAGALYTAGSQHRDAGSARILVERGQTLWELAETHPVAGQTTEQTADMIAELNGLDRRGVVAGAVIRIPADAPVDGGLALAMR
jgi:hypothetical protein